MAAFDIWIKVGLFSAGVLGLIVFFRSILRVAVLNRLQRDWVATQVGHAVRAALLCLARRHRHYGDIQKTMAWAFPIYAFKLIGVWFLLVQVSFALILLALESEATWLKAFIASGSALSTLGFATPSGVVGQLLAIMEGGCGLGIVVFMFTFIPGYRSATQAREDFTGWLFARTGARPTAFSLIEWCGKADQLDDLTPIWTSGESWFRGLLETHSVMPLLAFVPSVYSERTWIGAATGILDAASFAASSLNVKGFESARLCHATGVNALCLIARELPGAVSADTAAEENSDRFVAGYDAAFERFVSAGIAMKSNREECRRNFLIYRSAYEGLVRGIAEATLMPIQEPWVLPQTDAEGHS
jgi:hypothetical protein